jgi:hypothetical protein
MPSLSESELEEQLLELPVRSKKEAQTPLLLVLTQLVVSWPCQEILMFQEEPTKLKVSVTISFPELALENQLTIGLKLKMSVHFIPLEI